MVDKTRYPEQDDKIRAEVIADLISFDAPRLSTSLKNEGSRYRVTSAMQKAIRRGHTDIALRMANALATSMSPYFWYRICVVAMEDVLFGNIEATKKTLWLASNKDVREKYGNLKSAAYITTLLTNGGKDRSACDSVVLAGGAKNMKKPVKLMASCLTMN